MARTQIIIDIESEDEHFVRSASNVLVENIRLLIAEFIRHVPHFLISRKYPKVKITHDGKDVTEVIQ